MTKYILRCVADQPNRWAFRCRAGIELQFAKQLVNCSRWLGPQPRNFSSPAWSLSLVQIASQCEGDRRCLLPAMAEIVRHARQMVIINCGPKRHPIILKIFIITHAVKNKLILIIYGTRHPEKIWQKWLCMCLPYPKKVTALPCQWPVTSSTMLCWHSAYVSTNHLCTCPHPGLILGIHATASWPRYGNTMDLGQDCWLATYHD